MFSIVRTEASIPLTDNEGYSWIFDINLVHHHGWWGKERFDYNDFEIIKCVNWPSPLVSPALKEDLNQLQLQWSYKIDRIERGEFDNVLDPHHKDHIGKHLALYKEAIFIFRKLLPII